MLNITLDDEAEKYLAEILQRENITVSSLIKQLLLNRLSTLSPRKTVLERMGGMPKHLLSVGGLSDRDQRRSIIAERIQDRHQD